ncbi:roadblock/LC7 domain-containing protein [Streptomyces sp. HNM0645]|nr:roadblock/LC7 domain-containing protein [Streptomyces sp. HNM0645]
MKGLRDQISGITDTVIAAVDGILIAADTEDGIEPNELAALAAASMGIAQRTAAATGRGPLRRTVACGSRGCAAVYPVGDTALMVVLGDEGLAVEQLHLESQPMLKRIGAILSEGN